MAPISSFCVPAVLAVLLLLGQGQARSLLDNEGLALVQPGVANRVARVGVTGAHAAAAAADNLALMMGDSNLWDGVVGTPECKVTCNGENVTSADDNGKDVYSCWGIFAAFCKGKGEKGCGAAGFRCKGHFVGVKTECGARVAVCEGDKKGFAAKFFKYEGKKVAAFKAGGCLGTSSVIVKPYNKSSEDIALSWPADMPLGGDAAYPGLELLQDAVAQANNEGPLAQGRCGGYGGGVKVIKVKAVESDDDDDDEHEHEEKKRREERDDDDDDDDEDEDDEDEDEENERQEKHIKGEHMDFEGLESAVTKQMEEAGVAQPVPTMPSLMDFNDVFSQENGGPSCSITCNGKPAWFKGQFPCFGKLAVKCKPGIDAPKYAPKFFAASCKGFWTGFFGHRCKGQATAFVDTVYVDKLKICTGTFGMFAKAKKCDKGAKYVKGAMCKGKSLGALFLDDDDDAGMAV